MKNTHLQPRNGRPTSFFRHALLLACIFAVSAHAELTLPALISDNMVVQQNQQVNIWGWATPGERVTVIPSWDHTGSGVAVVADAGGRWRSKLQTPVASATKHTLVIKGGERTIVVRNVLVGEIWLCSGQSNMAKQMRGSANEPIKGGPEAIASSDNDLIRMFTVGVKKGASFSEANNDCAGAWVSAKPATVSSFSAVGYFFARELHAQLGEGVPVGIMNASLGGTSAQAWTGMLYLRYDDELNKAVDAFEQGQEQWQRDCKKADQAGAPRPRRPWHYGPSTLYNLFVAPVTPMTIRGVIWYQGESNAYPIEEARRYQRLFTVLINSWRDAFGNKDLPFYYVQLAGHVNHTPGTPVDVYMGPPRNASWAFLRESQLAVSRLANVGMAVAIDLGDANCIHPADKLGVGQRLALWALAKDYGMDLTYSGPIYSGYSIEGDRIRIRFNHAEGLHGAVKNYGSPETVVNYAALNAAPNDGRLRGFAIAGADRTFVWANAIIDAQDVIVHSSDVRNPVAVRYGWDLFPVCNLYNAAGLPASPFRTDNFMP